MSLPWESITYIPQQSFVYINCTAESQDILWTIELPGRDTQNQFTHEALIRILNERGFYELTEINVGTTMKTIRLFINSILENNGTVVRCGDIGSGMVIAQTTLILFGKCQLHRGYEGMWGGA